MDAAQRVKYIRKNLFHKTQEEFADAINISRSNLGGIETARVKLTERVAKDICKEFKINYLWLVDGSGNPINKIPDNIFDEIKKEYDLNEDDIFILKEYSEMKKDQRKRLKSYIEALIRTEKREED